MTSVYFDITPSVTVEVPDVFTIKDSNGNTFAVKDASGLEAKLIIIVSTSGRMIHTGICFSGNKLVVKQYGTFYDKSFDPKFVAVERLGGSVRILVCNNEEYYMTKLKEALGGISNCKPQFASISIGKKTIIADKYAAAINKDLKAKFDIYAKDPRSETNCIRFCHRAIAIGFDDPGDDRIVRELKAIGTKDSTATQIGTGWKSIMTRISFYDARIGQPYENVETEFQRIHPEMHSCIQEISASVEESEVRDFYSAYETAFSSAFQIPGMRLAGGVVGLGPVKKDAIEPGCSIS